MTDLLPCPFCGGEVIPRWALWPSDGDFDAIIHKEASGCGATVFSDSTADRSVIDAWNRRADNSASLAAALLKAEAALTFYADRDNYDVQWERLPCGCCSEGFKPVEDDSGSIARAALAEIKALTGGGDD